MIRFFGVGCLVLATINSVCAASILSGHLTFNGIRDELIDQSKATALDLDGSGGYSLNDVIYGFIRIDTVDRDVPTNPNGLPTGLPGNVVNPTQEIGILFAAQITSIVSGVAGAQNTTYALGAVTTAGYTLSDLMSTSLDAEVSPQLSNAADTIFIGVSSSTSPPIGGFTAISDFTGADYDFELAGGIASGSADFFHFQATSIDGLSGVEASGMTIFDHAFGSGLGFLPVYVDKDFTLAGEDITGHDTVLFDGNVTAAGLGVVDGHDAIFLTDNSNFALNGTPEPNSVVVWVALALAAFSKSHRRNRERMCITGTAT